MRLTNEAFKKLAEEANDTTRRDKAVLAIIEYFEAMIYDEIRRLKISYTDNDYEDYKQEARLGIIRAIPFYDDSKAAPSTFMQPIIRGAIYAASTIKRNGSKHLDSMFKDYVNFCTLFETANERKPTLSDICEGLNVTKETAIRYSNLIRQSKRDEDESDLLEQVADKRPGPVDIFLEKERKEIIKRSIESTLTENEKKIVSFVSGMASPDNPNGQVLCYKDIAQKLDIPMSMVSSLYKTALVKLRNNIDICDLYGAERPKPPAKKFNPFI